MKGRKLLFILGGYAMLLCLFFLEGQAQHPIFKTKVFDAKDGLANFTINDVCYDQDGFAWFATEYGLHKYDGLSFQLFLAEDYGFYQNRINDLALDENNQLWLGYFKNYHSHLGFEQIDIFDPITNITTALHEYVKTSLPFQYKDVTVLSGHADQSIWIGTQDGKVYEYKDQEFQLIFNSPEISSVRAVQKAPSGNGWLITIDGSRLAYFDANGQLLEKTILSSNLGNGATSIQENKGHKIITILEQDQLVFSLSEANTTTKQATQYFEFAKKQPYQPLDYIIPNTSKKLTTLYYPNFNYIIGIDPIQKDSFFVFDATTKQQLYAKAQLEHFPAIYDYNIDSYGNIWEGRAKENQISLTYPQVLKFKTHYYRGRAKENDPKSAARGIWISSDSTFYAAGFRFWEKKPNTTSKIREDFTTSTAILESKDKKGFWVTKEDGSLKFFDYRSQDISTYQYSSSSECCASLAHWAVHEDKNGQLWLGQSKGLSILDKNRKELVYYNQYNEFEQLKEATVLDFHENDKGIWVASTKGLFLLDPQKGIVDRFHTKGDSLHYLPHNVIAHIYEDQAGLFWLSSKGGGLIQWNPKTAKHQQLTTKNGLSHNIIYAAYEDDYGYLWLSSNYGIMSIDKKTFSVKIYHREDGLSDEEFNTCSHYQAADGRIYFGGLNGISSFQPQDFRDSLTVNYPLKVTSFRKQNSNTGEFEDHLVSLLKDNTITLFPHEKSFILKFALLDFRSPKTYQYAYKINGIDKDWNYLSTPEIRLNGLDYGQYILSIKAQGTGGFWNKIPLNIRIHVLTPFYLQWWFILSALGAILTLIIVSYRWRVQQLHQKQLELEKIITQRTLKIRKDKEVIELQAKELQALDKLKSRFFANISHELRTPLTLILGPLSYILDNPEEWNKEHIQEQLLTIQRNGKSLLKLVEEILDLSKLEANKLELKEEATPVTQFFEHIFSVFEPQLQNQQLDYELIFQLEDKNVYVLLDRNKLEKIVNNFLSNAIKFTSNPGKITLAITEKDTVLKIVVSDTGKGVHPNDLPHIFERFYQSKQVDGEAYGGTGIGLALVNEFANLMGGNAYAKSKLGEGSRFYFELPKKTTLPEVLLTTSEQLHEEQKTELIDAIGTDFNILVVEDNPDMQNFVVRLLKKRYNVLTAKNGLEGLEQLHNPTNHIHLVISDIMMPKMDGLTMLKHIKSEDKGRGIPVIMLTALAAEQDRLQALTIGVDDYLTKPFSVQELLIRVQNLLYNYVQRKNWLQEEGLELIATSQKASAPKKQQEVVEVIPSISLEEQEWLKKVEAYAKTGINNRQFNATQLYLYMNMTEQTFRRRLRKLIGMTANKYIRELRLQEARKLLEQKKYSSIQKICSSVGFSTPKYFSKQFKDRFGKNPSEYLK